MLGACSVVLPGGVAAAEDVGRLRIAHLSPDTPAADVTVSPAGSSAAAAAETGVGYGAVSPWHRLAPGAYTVAVRAAGVGASTAPVLSTRIDLRPGAARTVAVSGRFAGLRLTVRDEDLSPPAPGRARVRVVDAASAGSLDVSVAGGPPLIPGRPVDVPGGAATLEVSAAGAPPQRVPVDLAAGTVTTLLVLDHDGGLTVRPVLDAGGPSAVPVGPVQAGGGGTAEGFPLRLLGAIAGGVAGTLLLAAFRPRSGALVLVAVTGAGLVMGAPGQPSAAPPAPAPPVAVVSAAGSTSAAPVRVQARGIDAPVLPIGLDATGALVPPDDVATAGWFSGGPAPGDVGPAVIAGHVDSVERPGAFFPLRAVVPGDPITVTRADGSVVRFVVTRVARFPKSAFPTAEVYGTTPDAELRLVTCGGAFDRAARSYVDNVVVFARSA